MHKLLKFLAVVNFCSMSFLYAPGDEQANREAAWERKVASGQVSGDGLRSNQGGTPSTTTQSSTGDNDKSGRDTSGCASRNS